MRRLVALLLVSLCAVRAYGAWKLESSQSESNGGVEHRTLHLSGGSDKAVTLELAVFSAKIATLRVIDNPNGDSDLATAMRQHSWIAGVNGGYFDPQFAPIGLRVLDGAITSPLVRARLLTGVLSASRDRGIEIVRLGEFSRNRKLDAAMECGPFLVDLGARVRGLDDTRSARRTFAAVARGGRAALGYCEDATLAQLADMLATAQLSEGFTVWRAMNLDGGSSSAFWFRRADGSALVIAEQKNVRDFLGVVAK
ncbi:MAG: phosphodiester glycosidase family protein [Chthoniobacterales bacterium]